MDDFESYRPMMFAIAYRMLGSAMEAEDIVQEAFLRYQATAPETIHSLKAFLGTVVTRLCLDQMKSAQAQREAYLGPWLPEPVLTAQQPAFSVGKTMADYDSISMAFLVLLENLSPIERAVFLLREVFDYEYVEIGEMLGKEEAACRQLFSRAKKHIAAHRPRYKATPEAHQQMLGRFLMAIQAGELDGLMNLLAEDVTSWSDAGGKTHAATRPVYGRDRVARYFLGLMRKLSPDATLELLEFNGRLGVLTRLGGKPFSVMTIDTDGERVHAIRFVLNPDKLQRLT